MDYWACREWEDKSSVDAGYDMIHENISFDIDTFRYLLIRM